MIYIFSVICLMLCDMFLHLLNIKKKNKKFLILSFFTLGIIAALRDKTVGIDTIQFCVGYEEIVDFGIEMFSNMRFEWGFILFCKLLTFISHNSQALIIVTSIFINYSVMIFIFRNSKNVQLSLYMYILLNHFFMYMNVMRQAMAISIVLLSFEYLRKDKIKQFIFGVLIATLFHYSAIICLVFIALKKIKYKKIYNFFIFIISVFIFVFMRNIFIFMSEFIPQLRPYVGSEFDNSNYFGALFNFLVALMILVFGIFCKKQEKNNKNNIDYDWNVCYKIMICYVVCALLEMKLILFNRITPYFSIFAIIWLPNNLLKIKNSKNRLAYYSITLLFLFAYFLIIMYYRPHWYGCVPYKAFWDI